MSFCSDNAIGLNRLDQTIFYLHLCAILLTLELSMPGRLYPLHKIGSDTKNRKVIFESHVELETGLIFLYTAALLPDQEEMSIMV